MVYGELPILTGSRKGASRSLRFRAVPGLLDVARRPACIRPNTSAEVVAKRSCDIQVAAIRRASV